MEQMLRRRIRELEEVVQSMAPKPPPADAGPSQAMLQAILEMQRQLQEERRVMQEQLREREGSLHKREGALQEREAAVRERESKVAKREEANRPAAVHEADVGAAPGKKKARSRHADPMDDVPALVESFMSSGHIVPLGVHVAEVESLQQAATRLKVAEDKCMAQLQQLEDRVRHVLDASQQKVLKKRQDALEEERTRCERAHAGLVEQFVAKRDSGISRFMPLLLATVEKYDAAFERSAMVDGGEMALARISNLCESVVTKGRELRQPLPSALPCTEQATLMMLLNLAVHASAELNKLADDALASGGQCEVLRSPKPVKGIHRCMQKVQEEYEGDYTRLLDLTRVTIICETIVDLEGMLTWFLSAERAPRFSVCRTKDRLSRTWDAELSGGNRDVMINGWLSIGGHRKMIVEVQLHVRALFELKGDLHVLYAGARVLGASDDLMIQHDGLMSDDVLERTAGGVLRKLGVAHSPMSTAQRHKLVGILQREPCPMLELDVSDCKDENGRESFADCTIPELLVPKTGRLACWRLRALHLSNCGLKGDLESTTRMLLECRMLHKLTLSHNNLTGSIPTWLLEGLSRSLQVLNLSNNKLTGPIPDAITECSMLKVLNLSVNKLGGCIPLGIGHCKQLRILILNQCDLGGPIPPSLGECTLLEEMKLNRQQLTGLIPEALGKCSSLTILNVYQNKLSGPIPTSLGNCPLLERLAASDNRITAPIPDLSQWPKIKELTLESNDLSTAEINAAAVALSTPALVAAERAAIAQQEAAGGRVMRRLNGQIGDSVQYDVAQRKLTMQSFPTAGVPEMLTSSGVLYYELELVTIPRSPQFGL